MNMKGKHKKRVMKKSTISGFYRLSMKDRLKHVKNFANLEKNDIKILKSSGALRLKRANRMIENVIGTTHLPLGVAMNFMINKKEYMIPMAIEEPSVVAASSHAAKLARPGGGFNAKAGESMMIGQIQLVGVKKFDVAKRKILENKRTMIRMTNNRDSFLIKKGGGLKEVQVRKLKTSRGNMLIVHLLVDVKDAMGANAVNTMAETVSPFLEDLTKGKSRLKIISNLASQRLTTATATWKKDVIGEDTIEGILEAYAFAEADPYRCATHNKGIMNSVDAVVIATGNDFRAVEAGAHSYASHDGGYSPLAKYSLDKKGNLVGTITLPTAVGTVGGATRTHPVAKVALKILGTKTAKDLSCVLACVGLANNFAALRAMVKEGIQKGHMKLHAENLAISAGAKGPEITTVTNTMIEENCVTMSRALEILKRMHKERKKKMLKRAANKFRLKKKRR